MFQSSNVSKREFKLSPSRRAIYFSYASSLRPSLPSVIGFELGSSPRVRGTGFRIIFTGYRHRFIPARAGNGADWPQRRRVFSVHPRACRERPLLVMPPSAAGGSSPRIGICDSFGSSPRVRGTAGVSERPAQLQRFIPARAGNGDDLVDGSGHQPVHPRACGERRSAEYLIRSYAGSSPRVRGTVAATRNRCRNRRFIPARAGNGSPRAC